MTISEILFFLSTLRRIFSSSGLLLFNRALPGLTLLHKFFQVLLKVCIL